MVKPVGYSLMNIPPRPIPRRLSLILRTESSHFCFSFTFDKVEDSPQLITLVIFLTVLMPRGQLTLTHSCSSFLITRSFIPVKKQQNLANI